MAVDCVPPASRTLKSILKKKDQRDDAMRRYGERMHDLKVMEEEFPGNKATRSLKLVVAGYRKSFRRLRREWEQAEKKLCPHCKGAQWDPSYSGMAARSCFHCGGGGLLSDMKKVERRRFGDFKKFMKENSLSPAKRTRIKPGTIRQAQSRA